MYISIQEKAKEMQKSSKQSAAREDEEKEDTLLCMLHMLWMLQRRTETTSTEALCKPTSIASKRV